MQCTKYLKEARQYLFGLKNYILFSLYIFIIAIISGYIFAQNYPLETQTLVEEMKSMFPFQKETNLLQLFLFILENNAIKLFLVLMLGIFAGLIPFIVVFANGLILGIFAQIVSEKISWAFFFFGIVPHGIIEIPVLIVSSAISIRLGKIAIYRIFSKKEKLKKEFIKALKFFVLILIPLLFIAAFIETFITTSLLKMV